MHPSLVLLARLRLRAGLRKLGRGLRSVKGVLLALFTLGMLGFYVTMALFQPKPPPGVSPLLLHPATLFFFWLTNALGSRMRSPIAFSLPEVEFLFVGPFTRRQLLVYKLLINAFGALGFALMMSLFLGRTLASWLPATFFGMWLAFLFIQNSCCAIDLLSDWLGAGARRWRTALLATAVAAVAVSLWQAGSFEPTANLNQRGQAILSAWAVQAILSPFVVFSRLMTAETFLLSLPWAAGALAIVTVTIALVLKLDGNFLEASLMASQRRYEILRRAKRSGGLPVIGARSKPRFGLPLPPRLWGAGPIAWRQALQALRGSSRMLFLLPGLIAMIVPTLLMGDHPAANSPSQFLIVFFAVFIGVMVTSIIPLGVRADLDHVDILKTLPITPQAIVAGSISSAVIYPTAVQLLGILAVGFFTPIWTPPVIATVCFLVPFNLLLVASDSVLTILFPSTRQIKPGDPMAGVRMMLLYLVKFLLLIVAGAVAGLYVLAVYLVVGESFVPMAAGAWVITLAEGIATVWCASRLFARFDPSTLAVDDD